MPASKHAARAASVMSAVNAITGVCAVGFETTQLARGHVAIHHRHLTVHQHGVIAASGEFRERLPAVLGAVDFEAEGGEHAVSHLAIELLILDDEHPARERGERARVRIGRRHVAALTAQRGP